MVKFAFLSLLLGVISLTRLTCQQAAPSGSLCQAPPMAVPENYFGFRSSLLQIFTTLKVGCSGYLTKWGLVSRTQGGIGLYLSIWRLMPPPQNAQSTVYKLIGTTGLPPYAVTPDTWWYYQVPEPFQVQANDVVGIYYGDWDQPWSHNGFIPVTNSTQRLPKSVTNLSGKTLVIKKDADLINQEIEATNGYVDLSNSATVPSRLPAAIAFVDKDYVPGVTLPPTLPTRTQRTTTDIIEIPSPETRPTYRPPITTQPPPPPVTSRQPCRGCGGGNYYTPPPAAFPAIPTTTSPRKVVTTGGNRGPNIVIPVGGHSANCFAPMRSAGNCNFTVNKYSTKYFFNVPLRECNLFWFYEDCVRTTNLFPSKEACERSCAEFLSRDFLP